MKNVIRLLLILLTLLALTACQPVKPGGDEKPKVEDPAGTVFSPNVHVAVVKADQKDGGFSTEVQTLVSKLTGKLPTLVLPGAQKAANEIVIGSCEREIAIRAQEILDGLLNEEKDAGWVIYAEGGSIAVVYSGEEAMEAAFNHFRDNYFGEKTLAFATAHTASDSFSLREFYLTEENGRVEEALEGLAEAHGKELADAIRALYALYGDNMLEWLASLYDPESGGFYYSASARDTVGYLPDIKSTGDAVILMEYSGMARDVKGLRRGMSSSVKNAIGSFINKHQRSNRYFYNTIWDTGITADRRYSDLASAATALGMLGIRPRQGSVNSDALMFGSVCYFTAPVDQITVLPTSDEATDVTPEEIIPEKYLSREAFLAYLDSLNLLEDTDNACRTIAAEWIMIMATMNAEHVAEYLDSLRNADTGLYGSSADLDALRRYVTVSTLALSRGYQLKDTEKVTRVAIDLALAEGGRKNITEVLLPWMVLSLTVGNTKDETAQTEIDELLAENRVSLVTRTAELLAAYKKEDGSFSYFENENLHTPYGTMMAVPGVREGDIPSTCIAAGHIPSVIFSVLGLGEAVQIFTKTDLDDLTAKLIAATPIEKTENDTIQRVIDFEDETVGKAPVSVYASCGSPDPGYIKVVEENGNKFVELSSVKGEGYGDHVLVRTSPGTDGNALVLEAEICIKESVDVYAVQIYVGNGYLVYLEVNDGRVYINDASSNVAPDFAHKRIADFALGEWFRLRVEYYYTEAGTRTKLFVNENHIATSDIYYGQVKDGSVPPGNSLGYARIYLLYAAETVMQIDNIQLYRTDVPENILEEPVFFPEPKPDAPTTDEKQ